MSVLVVPRMLQLFILTVTAVVHGSPACSSSAGSTVRFSTSSYRNMTGHWLSQAAVTRVASGVVSLLQNEERSWQFNVDITRVHCGDDDTLTTVFHAIAPPPRVGSDYTFFRGIGFYKLHTEQLNWEEARKACAREGAHLAIVNSEDEEKAIREVMTRHQKSNFAAFIGVHDMFKEGEFVTIFGEPLSSIECVRWASSEPNNIVSPVSPEGEDCVVFYIDGNMNDGSCSSKLAFICEQDI